MPSWDSALYLKFNRERTQPSRDLAARIELAAPARAIDLGCGPGNSTAVLAQRWPGAAITGLDSSAAMLAQARAQFPQGNWIEGDIAHWARAADAPRLAGPAMTPPAAGEAAGETAGEGDRFEVVFSNAALQWVPDHLPLLPRLLGRVAPGGALALQVPANLDAPPHRVLRELAASAAWREFFVTPPRAWHVHAPEAYYDVLARHAARIDLWTTEYFHVLENLDGVVEWYRGTGLRPWLEALPDEATRARFLGAYRARLVPYFGARVDGRVLFPFRRLFVIAYK
jgi:trans-aconitate 2-methyltransferase